MLVPGDVILTDVTRVEVFGIFLDSEGDRLLVLVPEVSWTDRVADCRQVAAVGDQLRVRVLRFVANEGCWLASLKQAHPEGDPWRDPSVFAVGSRWTGTVAHVIQDTAQSPAATKGYLLQLQPGVSGFLNAEKLPGEFSVDDQLLVVIYRVDFEDRKIDLSPSDHPGYDDER